ncbi:MAG: hypothetical protein GXP49_15145 [Deltaproteobacteria bacterium]|nr:hypothetical protein [Deltaproteobacteria bacterium]
MKSYAVDTNTRIYPFNDPIGKSFILDESLADYTGRILKQAGREPAEPVKNLLEIGSEPAIVFFDNLYITRKTLEAFLNKASESKAQKAVLALPDGPVTGFAGPLQDRVVEDAGSKKIVLFDLFMVKDTQVDPSRGLTEIREDLLKGAERIIVEPEVSLIKAPSLRLHGRPLDLDIPQSLFGAAHLRHWVHLLWINRQALETRLLEMAEAEKEEGRLFLFGDKEYERWSKKKKPPVYVGENCNIHPSALVEDAVLGDNVTIDIKGLVRHAFLGDNVGLTAFHMALGSVVGNGCHTLADTCLNQVVSMPHSTLSNAKLEYTLVGSEAFVTTGVLFYGVGLDGELEVQDRGKWVKSGRRLLGGCVGHRCVLGTRAIFMGGRAVPNGYMVVLRPGDGIVKIPRDVPPGELLYNKGGSLSMVKEIQPPWQPPEW